jgi:hypothetical protein
MIFKRFISLLKATWAALPHGRRWCVERICDEPEILKPRVIYLVGEIDPWVAVFKCPCGCEKNVWLNLLKAHRPRWYVVVNQNGSPTVSPSVNRQVGCRSHFLLIDGKIKWC